MDRRHQLGTNWPIRCFPILWPFRRCGLRIIIIICSTSTFAMTFAPKHLLPPAPLPFPSPSLCLFLHLLRTPPSLVGSTTNRPTPSHGCLLLPPLCDASAPPPVENIRSTGPMHVRPGRGDGVAPKTLGVGLALRLCVCERESWGGGRLAPKLPLNVV